MKRKLKFKFLDKDESFYDFGIIMYLLGEYKSFGIEILGYRIFHIEYK